MSEALFQQDAYLATCKAKVDSINERGGIILDRTIFYATGGGQPGDSGTMTLADGSRIDIATTVYGEDRSQIVHVPAEGSPLPKPGEDITLELDWPRRHRLMRVHTALHLMCALVPYPVTGGQIGEDGGRLDFDIDNPDAIDKDELTAKLQEMVAADHQGIAALDHRCGAGCEPWSGPHHVGSATARQWQGPAGRHWRRWRG
jgi:misacylated tRNA(Ala) deacylase